MVNNDIDMYGVTICCEHKNYSANHVYCRRPGLGHLLNEQYRQPTHDSKQETDYSCLSCVRWLPTEVMSDTMVNNIIDMHGVTISCEHKN